MLNLKDIDTLKKMAKILVEERAIIKRIADEGRATTPENASVTSPDSKNN